MLITLFTGESLVSTPETCEADARKALEPWTQAGDRLARFESSGQVTLCVYSQGEPTDAFARFPALVDRDALAQLHWGLDFDDLSPAQRAILPE